MKITKYINNENICTLYIDNVRKNGKVDNCIDSIKRFIDKEEFYFVLYRIDGINLKVKESKQYEIDIGEYLRKLEYLEIFKNYNSKSLANGILHAVGKMKTTNDTYQILPKMFDYYLDTVIFKPKIPYKEFSDKVMTNSMKSLSYYIEEGISDIGFAHVDSGDFMICFNKEVYNENEIIKIFCNYI